MSGPNKSYDPVQVAPLDAPHVEAMVAEALVAFQAATSVAELKQARLAHAGDRSPIALANREIGALPPQARKDAGSRIGQARGARHRMNRDLSVQNGNGISAQNSQSVGDSDSLRLDDDSRLGNMDESRSYDDDSRSGGQGSI